MSMQRAGTIFHACTISEILLELKDVTFTNNTIAKGWLGELSRGIDKLTISTQQLVDIEEAAFSGTPFADMSWLVIENSRIKYLRKNFFIDLSIETFEFRCKKANLLVEFNALEHIAKYLKVIQFSTCLEDPETIKNITGPGVSQFTSLVEFDLRDNLFETILNQSFVNTPRLTSLYLSRNGLSSIDVNALYGIGTSIELLDMQDNNLKTLPDGVFRDFKLKDDKIGTLSIQGNPWRCDCDLLWFRDFYITNIKRYFHSGAINFTCTEGDYSEVVFCPHNSSDSTTTGITSPTIETVPTTTASTTTSSTEKPGNLVYLDCTSITNYQDALSDLNRIYTHTVHVRNGTVTYNFYQIQNTPNFEIKLLNSVGKDYLIWINSKNSSDYGCVTDIQETVILNNLRYGFTYTICLLKESADMVTPFDCTSLTVPLEWEYCPWIINKYMPAVIGGVLGITLVIIIITALIMFYTVRQNPKLIKGNKRVVIVRNKSADALVMPNYDKQQYIPPSIYTNSEGYLTPRHKLYEKINERRFRPLNTITEKFYQDLQATASRQSRSSSYTGFLHRRSVGSEVYEPPPLPPNHPCERPSSSRQSTIYGN